MTLEEELTLIKRDVEKLKRKNEITEFLDEVILNSEEMEFTDSASVTVLDDASQLIGSCRVGFFQAV